MMSIIGKIRDNIAEVLGPTGRNEYLSLMMPGLPLDQDEYKRPDDQKILTQIAESRLADQLYNVGKVVAGPNQKKLSAVYRQILGMIVPDVDAEMAAQLVKIEHWLNQQAPDGTTLLQAYEKKVDAFVQAQEEWAEKMAKQKAALSEADYEDWFDKLVGAESTKLSNLQTEIDAMIPRTIIDTVRAMIGSEGPAAGARAQLDIMNSVSEGSTQGGRRLPVNMEPNDWADSLASNFSPIDLLKSPEQITRQLELKQSELVQQQVTVDAILSAMSSPDDVAKAAKSLDDAKANYEKAQNDLQSKYTESVVTAAKIYMAHSGVEGKVDKFNKDVDAIKDGATNKSDDGKIGSPLDDKQLKELADQLNAVGEAQNAFTQAAADVSDKGISWIEKANVEDDYGLADSLHGNKVLVNDIKNLETKLKIATGTWNLTKSNLFPRKDKGRYSEITISSNSNEFKLDQSEASSYERTSWSVDLFFGSASGNSSKATANFSKDVMSSSEEIKIGMLATRVNVDMSGWFNPDFLALEGASKISSDVISRGVPTKADWEDADKLNPFNDHTLLPSYPVSLLIVKDVSITFKAANSKGHQASDMLDKHSSVGGGFLCFSASHSSASHKSNKSVSTSVQGTDVTIRIPGPQVLGVYMELVPQDTLPKSDFSDNGAIGKFIGTLNEYNSAKSEEPQLVGAH